MIMRAHGHASPKRCGNPLEGVSRYAVAGLGRAHREKYKSPDSPIGAFLSSRSIAWATRGGCPCWILPAADSFIGALRPCHSPVGAGSCVLWISRVVARAGSQYHVAAEMDFYPRYLPWAFVIPSIAGAREDEKLSINLSWDREAPLLCGCDWWSLYIEGRRIRLLLKLHKTCSHWSYSQERRELGSLPNSL
jgi:hypothetical protein